MDGYNSDYLNFKIEGAMASEIMEIFIFRFLKKQDKLKFIEVLFLQN